MVAAVTPLFLDLETRVGIHTDDNGNEYSDYGVPYNKDNYIVLGGYVSKGRAYRATTNVQNLPLQEYTTIVGHNIKYDALWLRSIGHDISKLRLEDTMLREVIASCGVYGDMQSRMCNLDNTGQRRGGKPKADLFKIYLGAGINTNQQPPTVLAHYLKGDVWNTAKAYIEQEKDRRLKKQRMYLEFATDLIHPILEMEYNGAQYNFDAEDEVYKWLIDEQRKCENKLWSALKIAIGEDLVTQLLEENGKFIDSSTEMSRIIYGVKLNRDKSEDFKAAIKWWKPWKRGAQAELNKIITEFFEPVEHKHLGVKPQASWMQAAQVVKGQYIGASGFLGNSKLMSAYLSLGEPKDSVRNVIEAYLAYTKTRTWINTNFASFKKGLCDDGRVHGSFNQCGTVTMRFSSTNPNLQNLPREGTMPLKRLITSRYDNGYIINADYGQLEFRVCGWLAGDALLIQDVDNGFDIHLHTAKIAFKDKFGEVAEDGELTPTQKHMRQQAKAYTFAFQYGAVPKTKIQQAVYDAFYNKYTAVRAWQERVEAEIIQHQAYTCPLTGKIFSFKNANEKNIMSWATKAKNYPVQFLSAVITQCAMKSIYDKIYGRDDMKMILQVHDSIALDVESEVLEEAAQILYTCMKNVTETFEKYFNKKVDVPMDVDIEYGITYFDQHKYNFNEEKLK